MRNTCGFTLLEVMISLFILSLILLGVTAAEIKALREARTILYFNQAISLGEEMAGFMLAHHGDASGYLQKWQLDAQQNLPSGTACVAGMSPYYTIYIKWGGYDQPCRHTQSGTSGCVKISVAV